MENKRKYAAPAVIEDLALEFEAEILGPSTAVVDENIKEVNTTGQTVGGTINENQWSNQWQ